MRLSSKRAGDGELCLIDNPLRDLLPGDLEKRADEFARLVGQSSSKGLLSKPFRKLVKWARLSQNRDLTSYSSENDKPDEALVQLFRKAAYVAQNPRKLDSLQQLSDHEKIVLKTERDVQFWDQPKTLRVTIVTLCFSAIIQGWVQTGINGANQFWPKEFNLVTERDGVYQYVSNREKWVFAGVNAITYLAASLFGCWLSDPLQSMVLGRRGAIFASGLLCFASLIGSACTHNWQQLLVCRALVGLGLGAKASVTPIFGAEISPAHLRGALVMNWQLFDAFGIFLGFCANLVLSVAQDSLSWRLQFAAAIVPTACLLTLIWTIPESPRWLLKQRRHRDAFTALCALRQTHLQAAVELFYANAQLQIEADMQPKKIKDIEGQTDTGSSQHVEHADHIATYKKLTTFQDSYETTNFFSRIWQLFRDPRTRRATVAAAVVMISQQLCGVNVLIFYSSTFFRDAALNQRTGNNDDSRPLRALWLSWGVGLANFVFTLPAYYFIDTKGRRCLLFWSYPGMILSMLAACVSFLHPNAVVVKVSIFMFIYMFFYSWGQGPVAFAYSSEVFPLINREAGMSFAVFINLLGAGILTLFVPQAQTESNSLTSGNDYATYCQNQARLLAFFVGSNVLALILIFLFVPETAGASIRKEDGQLNYMRLEELNYIFGVSTWNHISYQVRVMVPYAAHMSVWWICHWFTKKVQKPAPPKKMWFWAEMRDFKPSQGTATRAEDRKTSSSSSSSSEMRQRSSNVVDVQEVSKEASR